MYFDGSILEVETIQMLVCQFDESIIRNGKGNVTLLKFDNVLYIIFLYISI
jgi:hypothetical protein